MEGHRQFFSRRSVFIAVLIGLTATVILVFRDFDLQAYRSIKLQQGMWLILLAVILMLILRVFGYVLRLRILTEKALSWTKCLQVILLWEFTSALTPTVIGGTAAALFIMAREKLNVARSTSVVLLSAVLDEVYYLLAVPLFFLIIGFRQMFPPGASVEGSIASNLPFLFFAGYLFLLIFTLAILTGLLWKPLVMKKILFGLTRLPFLRRFRRGAISLGNDLQITAVEFRYKPFSFWVNAFGATALTWTARFFTVNLLMLSFTHPYWLEHFIIFGRQLTMWVILILTPLPGAGGVAEGSFSYFLDDFMPQGAAAPMALIWRLFSYYVFIIAGAITLPRWLKRTNREHQQATYPQA